MKRFKREKNNGLIFAKTISQNKIYQTYALLQNVIIIHDFNCQRPSLRDRNNSCNFDIFSLNCFV